MDTTFKVTSTFPFPLDMLRYDGCWPFTTEDANLIEASISAGGMPYVERTITLQTSGRHGPTRGRWASFMWKVEK